MNEKIIGEVRAGICWCGRRIMERLEMPARRGGFNFEFTHDDLRYHASVGMMNGRPTEVFLNCAKVNSAADLVARDAAVLLSIVLQYGIPLKVLASSALGRNPDDTPSSPIGKLLEILVNEGSERERNGKS